MLYNYKKLLTIITIISFSLLLQSCSNNPTVKQIKNTKLSRYISKNSTTQTITFEDALSNCPFVKAHNWEIIQDDDFYQVVKLTISIDKSVTTFSEQIKNMSISEINAYLLFKYSKTAVTYNDSLMIYLDKTLINFERSSNQKNKAYQLDTGTFLMALIQKQKLSLISLVNAQNQQPIQLK